MIQANLDQIGLVLEFGAFGRDQQSKRDAAAPRSAHCYMATGSCDAPVDCCSDNSSSTIYCPRRAEADIVCPMCDKEL